MAGKPFWEDPEEFRKKVEEYFEDKTNFPQTWTGLARFLGFESRQSLEDYKSKEGFSYPIKNALLRIEEMYERGLYSKNPAGPIFALKNFGWKDKQEIDQSTRHSGEINHSIDYSKLSESALREIAAQDRPKEG